MKQIHQYTQITITATLMLFLLTSCTHKRPAPQPLPTDIKVGSYYFPGYFHAARWSPMVANGGPTPLLGHYRDGAPGVSDWHIRWAVEHGISFFVFDWYCSLRNGPNVRHNTAIDEGFLKAEYRNLMEFALMWCNEERDNTLYTVEDMLGMARYMGRYFNEDNYLCVDGRPLIVIARPSRLIDSFGKEFRDLIPRLSREAGLPPGKEIFFVALASNPDPKLREMGFAATTAYNYASHRAKKHGSPHRATYDDMIEGYEQIWKKMTAPGALPYIVPVSPGWDSRPWYGTRAFVRTGSTPEKFRDMCQRAREYVNPELNMVISECWNEFGEGSYIEPCEENGFAYLQAIRDTFASGKKVLHEQAVPSEEEKRSFTFHTIPPQLSSCEIGKQEGNLVPDPGMEEGTGWIAYSGVPCQFTTDNPHSGQRSLLLQVGQGCKTEVPMPVVRGRVYRASAWVKCAPEASVKAQVTWFDSKNHWTKKYDIVAESQATEWTQLSRELVVVDPKVTAVSFEFVGRGADVWVDDVSIENTGSTISRKVVFDAECATGKDWITFEGADPVCESSSEGAPYVLLTDRQGIKTRRTLPVKPGEFLDFRVELKCDPLASVTLRSAVFDSKGGWISGKFLDGGSYSWQDWIEITGVICVPDDTTADSINLECFAEGGNVRIRKARIERSE